MTEIAKFAPQVLEITRQPKDEASVTARLRLTPAFDFGQQLDSLRNSGARDLLDEFGGEGDREWLQRPLRLEGRAFLLRLSQASQDEHSSDITLSLRASDEADDPASENQMREAITWATRRFWWELDFDGVREALSVDEYGEDLLAHYWPLRPTNMASPWEGLLKTVISVQIYPGLATRLQQGLLDFYNGGTASFEGRQYKFWPSVERLAEIVPDDLLGMKFSRQKARYLPAIADMVLQEPQKFDWERLRALPGREAVAVLDELPGVGPWIAQYVAMRGLPHQDIFIDEGGLRKALAAAFDRRADLSGDDLARLTAPYAPYRSIACYYSYMKMYSA